MCMLKLVRFISLANEVDLCRAIRTISTGEFWCSNLWHMNDPMEGVYLTSNETNIKKIYNGKKERVICSFTDNNEEKAVKNPLLWGYYANGFKGIAIEIEICKNEKMKRVQYHKEIDIDKMVEEYEDKEELIDTIITGKLKLWEGEGEWRYLERKGVEGYYKIGRIEQVYIGCPYGNVRNYPFIVEDSDKLQKYLRYTEIIEKHCRYLSIDSNKSIIPKYAVFSKGEVEIQHKKPT